MVNTKFNYFYELQFNPESEFISEFRDKLNETKVLKYTGVSEKTDLKSFYKSLSEGAGNFVKRDEDYKSGDQNEQQEEWLDITFIEEKKKETFRHSDTRQPLHTDGAYTSYHFDISFFYCMQNAEIGGATTFIDGSYLIDILGKYENALLRDLEQNEIIFDKGLNQKKISKAIWYDEHGPMLNWNHFRISNSNSKDVIAMCNAFQDFLENKIVSGGLLTSVYLKKAEAVFFHDYRVLHGRNSFYGNRSLMKGGLNL